MSPKNSRTFFAVLSSFVLAGVMVFTAGPALASAGDIRSATNSYRAGASLPKLESKGMGAQGWAEHLLSSGNMTHDNGWLGSGPGGGANSWAENIAYRCGGDVGGHAAGLMEQWKGSAPHKANMLGDFTHLGVGWASDGNCTYAVQRFARIPGAAPAPDPVAPAPEPAPAAPAPQQTPKSKPAATPKETAPPQPTVPEAVVTPTPPASPSPSAQPVAAEPSFSPIPLVVANPSPLPAPTLSVVAQEAPSGPRTNVVLGLLVGAVALVGGSVVIHDRLRRR